MSHWHRARRDQRCACKGCDIQRGDPVRLFGVGTLSQPHVYCASCAEEAVPANLPPLEPDPELVTGRATTTRLQQLGTLSALRDWKAKQVPE